MRHLGERLRLGRDFIVVIGVSRGLALPAVTVEPAVNVFHKLALRGVHLDEVSTALGAGDDFGRVRAARDDCRKSAGRRRSRIARVAMRIDVPERLEPGGRGAVALSYASGTVDGAGGVGGELVLLLYPCPPSDVCALGSLLGSLRSLLGADDLWLLSRLDDPLPSRPILPLRARARLVWAVPYGLFLWAVLESREAF
jgi:hypothetical protein